MVEGSRVLRGPTLLEAEELQPKFTAVMERAVRLPRQARKPRPSFKCHSRADEHVEIEEFMRIVRVHVLSAYDYLMRQ